MEPRIMRFLVSRHQRAGYRISQIVMTSGGVVDAVFTPA